MDTFSLTTFTMVGELSSAARVEAALVAVIVVITTVLVTKRFLRNGENRRRKARHDNYFDRDAAHYGPGGKDVTSEVDGEVQIQGWAPRRPTAPSFTSSKRSARARFHSSEPARTSSSGSTIERLPADSLTGTSGTAPVPSLKPKGGISVDLPPMPSPPLADTASPPDAL